MCGLIRLLLRTTGAVLVLIGSVHAQESIHRQQARPQMDLPRATLRAGMYRIEAQVAQTTETRQIGLMFRQDMPEHEGMLFVFPQSAIQCFWMKNTILPLSAAFINHAGEIVNLADMQPLDETSHCSASPVAYVLEVNQGWFERHGLQAGDRIEAEFFQQIPAGNPATAADQP